VQTESRTTFEGSRPSGEGREHVEPVDHAHVLEVLLLLRDQGEAPPEDAFVLGSQPLHEREHLDHDELLRRSTASEADLEAVRAFAADHQLEVLREDPAARTVTLSGRARDLNRAFGTELHHYRLGEQSFHSHEEDVSVPREIGEVVEAVFGLDNRAACRRPGAAAATAIAPPPVNEHTKPPAAFRELYGFPDDARGDGQCIALLQFQGGFDPKKLETYLGRLGVAMPEIVVREIGNGRNDPVNKPNDVFSEDIEVYMDIEIVAGIAPGAKIVVYFGENTDKGWMETVNAAIFDKDHQPSVVSISYGMAEHYWQPHTLQAIDDSFRKAAHLGITVCCSSGDFGAYEDNDPPRPFTVPFPASSPHVLTCGGTRLETTDGPATHEAVWNQSHAVGLASGGGVSRVHGLPPFQARADVPPQAETKQPGRGMPDVAANASTRTGYHVWADDTEMSMGGTSAAAPLWAGLVACLNGALGRPVGYLTPLLYTGEAQAAGALRDIVDGDNRNEMMGAKAGYQARPGWDACTGLGTPRAQRLLDWLRG
jgi:kumamolisin